MRSADEKRFEALSYASVKSTDHSQVDEMDSMYKSIYEEGRVRQDVHPHPLLLSIFVPHS